ncbi:MAG: porphobilinogen synthase, partial [Bacillaceae bacterium]|nr:porphobilinogen synthase [Bacillaceae bacterium]
METLNFRRHRRLRKSAFLRDLVREHHLSVDDLIYPLFVVEGNKVRNPVPSM